MVATIRRTYEQPRAYFKPSVYSYSSAESMKRTARFMMLDSLTTGKEDVPVIEPVIGADGKAKHWEAPGHGL